MDWGRLVGTAEDVRRVFENVPAMIVAFEGPQHRYIAANAAYRAFATKFDAMGQPVREIWPEVEGQYLFERFDDVYSTGIPQHLNEWRVFADLDGSGTPRELFLDLAVTPRSRSNGTVEGVQLIVTDVTARVQARLAAERRAQEMSDRYLAVRDSATLMQQALLASSVPVTRGADIAAEYLVAAEDTAAGGDWFDAIALPGDRLVLVVGDVVGHGVEAAAVMSQLRTALRMPLSAGQSITDALQAVDRFSDQVPGARSATVCVGILDTKTGNFQYCTAGHPPPLVISADHHPRFLEPSGAGPLGSGRGFSVRTEMLEIGDTVLEYSDGIVERPGRPLAISTVEFANVAASVLGGAGFPIAEPTLRPVDRLCSQTLELLLRTTGYSDDVTLLAAQRRTPPAPLHLVVDADPHAARVVRAGIREWLQHIGADPADNAAIVHAVSEYVENAAEHAYPTAVNGGIVVRAELGDDGNVGVSVTDHGQWQDRPGGTSNRGRGLAMAAAFVTDTRVTHDAAGTTATLTHRLSRIARIVTDPRIIHVIHAAAHRETEYGFTVNVDHSGHVVIAGDVDSLTAPTLAGQLSTKTGAGTSPVTIDLTAVTHLGSAGVAVLADAWQRANRHQTECTLLAPPGSAAHHVLTLVQLPVAACRSPEPLG
jgi:anti-anti-sigma factor